MVCRKILVIGGTGFIGSHVLARLAEAGCEVRVPTRRAAHATHLLPLPGVDAVEADVHDDATLDRLVQERDAVINLAGILHDRPGPAGSRYGRNFERVHVALPRRIAQACARAGVRRLLHMSALGADPNGPSMYQRSKGDGEAAAKSEPSLAVTIFRPSVVFGEEDKFLNLFASLQRMLPVMFLAGADARFQPVYVGDVAQAFAISLNERRTVGKTYELAGPRIYTLRELVRLAGEFSGHRRPVIGVPHAMARVQALLLEHLPGGPLMSRDNLDSMMVDNIRHDSLADELGIRWTPLEAVAPRYLRNQSYRGHAAA